MSRLALTSVLLLLLFAPVLYAKDKKQKKTPRPGPTPRTEEYCILLARVTFGGLGSKVTVTVDFGQNPDSKWFDAVVLKHEDGKPIKFESVIDALNHMNSYGWELMNAFPMSSKQGTAYHYLMRRKISEGDEAAKEGDS